ncbi:hypothetical protein LE191_04250 [Janthinobacterium sp. HSC-3S05]|uniref:hypothetical protein n=1 Tax=Janthinobacterium lividum TaxID=29581 RepID=UPI001CD86EBC|nr:hypothetical protein [Janthinobacterium lividum]MCA1859321.1 hypothetical protein [Janthinobacterium lividum]
MFDKLIENFPKILRALNFARMIQVAILAILFTVLYIAWDARQALVESIKVVSVGRPSRNLIVGDEVTVKAVRALVDRSQLINGLQIINTNFRSNTRTTAYFYSDRRDLQLSIDTAVQNKVSPTALFMTTGGGVPEHVAYALMSNIRVIDIIQAEFVCYESNTTPLAKMAPEFTSIAPVICSISIPPYAGKFSGYLNLFLTRQPSTEEKSILRDAARALASDIFDRELAR